MSSDALKLAIVARDQSDHVQNGWAELSRFLSNQESVDIVATAITEDLAAEELDVDLVVVLGGDGAILRACRRLQRNQRPIIGINFGRLGFLADLSLDEFCDRFDAIKNRDFQVIDHLMFESELIHADGQSETFLGLNETVIGSAAAIGMIDIELAINDEPVTTYSGDGLIISTPVGSTAHSLSAGGPLLKQDLNAFVITPICPHTLTNRPLVDHSDGIFRLSMPEVPDGVTLVIDGQIKRPLKQGDSIQIRKADFTFKLAKTHGHSYYSTLNKKLGWGGQPRYTNR